MNTENQPLEAQRLGDPDAGEPYREPEVSPLDQYNEALLANVHPPAGRTRNRPPATTWWSSARAPPDW